MAAKGDKNASSVSLSVPQHGSSKDTKLVRVSYLTEQTSHHPPVSAFHVTCPEKGITARGFDQITAKFTGTSVKVLPGEHNMGIFISLDKRDGETYQLTHPAAHLGGLLRGALSVSVSEMAYITCPKTKIKVILHYIEEGWLGRTTNKIDGVVFKYDPENDTKTRVQDVPDEDVLARLSGPWKEKVIFTLGPRPVVSGYSRWSVIMEINCCRNRSLLRSSLLLSISNLSTSHPRSSHPRSSSCPMSR